MDKTYDVDINILSVITTDGSSDEERAESDYKGTLTVSDDRLCLSYSEKTEGVEMKTDIHLCSDRVVVKRRGAIVSDMVFAEGKKNTSDYSIPPHSFDMTVECRRLKAQIGEREGRVDLLYKMEIGGEARGARMRIIWN